MRPRVQPRCCERDRVRGIVARLMDVWGRASSIRHGPEARSDRDESRSVSVVIPTYRPATIVKRCVESLVDQSLDRRRFEVLLIVNGPSAANLAPYRQLCVDFAEVDIRLIATSIASVGHARNVGIAAASMPWVTFVDDDDTVAPDFLSGLLERARAGVVPLTSMDDIGPDGTTVAPDSRTVMIRALGGTVVDPTRCPHALGFNAAKLIPTGWARAVRYHESLRSGEDVCFFAELYARFSFDFDVLPADERQFYHRHLSAESVSRRRSTGEFAVEERLDVIAHLARPLGRSRAGKKATIYWLLASQAEFIRQYLVDHPDRRDWVEATIRQRGIASFPWRSIGGFAAETLVVSVCCPPFADPSAVTVAKRVRERGELVDVICNDMSTVRAIDESLHAIAGPLIGVRKQLDAPTTFGDWTGIRTFAELGWLCVDELVAARGPYRTLYSRAMWPASHALGALVKLRMPVTHWIAEFSDPIARTVTGEARSASLPADDLVDELLAGAQTIAAIPLPTPTTVYELMELLPYAAADEIWFTNESQREYMLSYCGSNELAELVRAKSDIRPHPIPESDLYHRVAAAMPDMAGRIRLAYFGTFYANRSIGELLSAFAEFPAQVRARLHLDIYSGSAPELVGMIQRFQLDDVVCVRDQVSYLECLNLTTQYDCLVVNDAVTAQTHTVNPYLPSKWSDYRGSGTAIWAMIEPASTLAGMTPELRSVLGDQRSTSAVLHKLAQLRPVGVATRAIDAESPDE